MYVQVDLPRHILDELNGLAKQYNLKLEEVLQKVLTTVSYELIDDLKSEADYLIKNLGLSKEEALGYAVIKLISLASAWYVASKALDDLLQGVEKRGFYIAYTNTVKNHNGVYVGYDPLGCSKSILSSVDVQLQNDGSAFIKFETFIGFKYDYGDKKFLKLVDRLKKAIEYYKDYINDLEIELGACCDYAEVTIEELSISDRLGFIISVYVDDWHCIPSIDQIEELSLKIIRKARLTYYLRNR